MAKRLIIRRDTAANWLLSNPVLEAGELAMESDTENLKMGNGMSMWSDLDYYIIRPALRHQPQPEGSVRLELLGQRLTLLPYMGDVLFCNGKPEVLRIGYTLTTAGLAPDTTYFIYATLMNSNWQLSASTIGFQMSRGIAVMNGSPEQTLVGMARTNSATQWEDSLTKRFVLSWYNKRTRKMQAKLPANINSQSVAWAELDNHTRVEFLSWSDYYGGEISASVMGTGTTANTATNMFTGILLDNVPMFGASGSVPRTASTGMCPVAAYSAIPQIDEGYHWLGIAGKISGTVAAATWFGGFGQYEGVVLEATTLG